MVITFLVFIKEQHKAGQRFKHADCVYFALNNDQQNELAVGHRKKNCGFFSPPADEYPDTQLNAKLRSRSRVRFRAWDFTVATNRDSPLTFSPIINAACGD